MDRVDIKYLPMKRRGDLNHVGDQGYPGFINLIGIESPGLTSAPAIAEMVAGMVDGFLD